MSIKSRERKVKMKNKLYETIQEVVTVDDEESIELKKREAIMNRVMEKLTPGQRKAREKSRVPGGRKHRGEPQRIAKIRNEPDSPDHDGDYTTDHEWERGERKPTPKKRYAGGRRADARPQQKPSAKDLKKKLLAKKRQRLEKS
jgi:hypothetical protein